MVAQIEGPWGIPKNMVVRAHQMRLGWAVVTKTPSNAKKVAEALIKAGVTAEVEKQGLSAFRVVKAVQTYPEP